MSIHISVWLNYPAPADIYLTFLFNAIEGNRLYMTYILK